MNKATDKPLIAVDGQGNSFRVSSTKFEKKKVSDFQWIESGPLKEMKPDEEFWLIHIEY